MARHKLDSVSDFARQGYYLRIRCLRADCAHTVDAHPVALMEELHRLRLPLAIDALEDRLKCSACGRRGAHVTPSLGAE